MNRIVFSFIVTAVAGFSTLLGMLPCFFKKQKSETIIALSLAFSAGIMLTISVFSLIPEAFILTALKFKIFPACLLVAIFVVIGILFSIFVDKKIDMTISNNQLYKLGLISVIALMLHNIPEGITTFVSSNVNQKLGITLAISIALHNIPEGISIAVPIYYSTGKIKKAFAYTVLSGFSEFAGAIVAYLFLAKYVNDFVLAIILACTAGIMLHISMYELIPNALSYGNKNQAVLAFILGSFVMVICGLVF